uniref:Uncharacterized protein n=1 Tax=Oryza nivara TaxID=4536 RepID=A0A0E0FGL9_ORYNI
MDTLQERVNPVVASALCFCLVLKLERWDQAIKVFTQHQYRLDGLIRLRYSSEVSLKSTGSSWPLSKPQSPKSSHVTRPSASPQLTPSHRQQSSPAFHESKAAMDSLVMEKELFSWSRAAAWSGKHGTAGDMALESIGDMSLVTNDGMVMRGSTGRSGERGGSPSGHAAKAPTRVASALGWAEIAVGKWALIAGGHYPTRHLTAQHDTRQCYSATRLGHGGAAMACLGRRRRRGGCVRRRTKGLKPAILVVSAGHGQHLPARQGQGGTRRSHTLGLIVHALLSGAPTPLAARLRRRENATRQS